MATDYPDALDVFTAVAGGQQGTPSADGRVHSARHNDVEDAVEAVQAELGINPAGSEATVAARLGAIEGVALAPAYVTRYGATGDGVTDDTAALLAARDSGSLEVRVPAGTYVVTTLTLNVAGQSWVLLPGAVIKLKPATSASGIVKVTAAGVRLSGGKVDGNLSSNTYAYCYGVEVSAADVTVAGVEVTATTAGGVSLVSGATGCLVRDCYLHDTGTTSTIGTGILVSGATRCRVIGNRCEDNGVYGTGDQTYDGNGIYLAGGDLDGYNVVEGNTTRRNARRGIKVQERAATITGNSLCGDSSGIGVTVAPSPTSTPTTITGNTIRSTAKVGLQLDNCAFVTVTGNTISDTTDHAVSAASTCNNVVFAGNTVLRSARHGLNLVGITDWNISGNLIVDCGTGLSERFGINLNGTYRVAITGNTVQNSGSGTSMTRGICLAGANDRINITGNLCYLGLTAPITDYTPGTNVTQTANRTT